MSCSCSIDIDADTNGELLSKQYPIARIQHICSECKKIIQPKEKYLKEVLVWENNKKPETFKTCLVCENIRNILFCGWIYGGLMNDLYEFIAESDGQISENCICKLIPEAKEIVCNELEKFFKCQEDNDSW